MKSNTEIYRKRCGELQILLNKAQRRIKKYETLELEIQKKQHQEAEKLKKENIPIGLEILNNVLHYFEPTKITNFTGIYFLVNQINEVVYIGQSTNIIQRVMSHRSTKQFDGCYFFICEESKLDDFEKYWVGKILPPLNRESRTRRLKKLTQCGVYVG